MCIIHAVGLGPGDEKLITKEGETLFRSGLPLYLRTEVHPSAEWLKKEQIRYVSCDFIYEREKDFDSVYRGITEYIISEAKKKNEIVYAVPGSPTVAERTIVLLRERAREENIDLRISAGMSFLEVLYVRTGLDPVNGLTIADAEDMDAIPASILHPLVITQIYSRAVASDVKLTLMDRYGDESDITMIRHLTLPDEEIETIPLCEMDRRESDHLTSALFFPSQGQEAGVFDMQPLIDVMKQLREPGGCPWDRLQDHRSLRRYLVQETAEVLDAVDRKDMENLCEELGDMLLQIVFHARIAEENGDFTMEDVIQGICDKMIRRHPFVFGETRKTEAAEAIGSWEIRKLKEKHRSHLLPEMSGNLPSLMFTCIMQDKVSSIGIEAAQNKGLSGLRCREKWQHAVHLLHVGGNSPETEDACGEVLFHIVNLFRICGIDSELALHGINRKFQESFCHWEDELRNRGLKLENLTREQIEDLWKGSGYGIF